MFGHGILNTKMPIFVQQLTTLSIHNGIYCDEIYESKYKDDDMKRKQNGAIA